MDFPLGSLMPEPAPNHILESLIEAIPAVMAGRPTPLIWPLPKPFTPPVVPIKLG